MPRLPHQCRGLINVYSELKGYNREQAMEHTRKIYDTTLEIFAKAEAESLTTIQAAKAIVEERLASARQVKA